jgi:hypothetical protein
MRADNNLGELNNLMKKSMGIINLNKLIFNGLDRSKSIAGSAILIIQSCCQFIQKTIIFF